jgi:hypothetical protein
MVESCAYTRYSEFCCGRGSNVEVFQTVRLLTLVQAMLAGLHCLQFILRLKESLADLHRCVNLLRLLQSVHAVHPLAYCLPAVTRLYQATSCLPMGLRSCWIILSSIVDLHMHAVLFDRQEGAIDLGRCH